MTALIWIDWYAYHVARLRALTRHASLRENIVGVELVGGAGVHGQVYRSSGRDGLPIVTLRPEAAWGDTGQAALARAVWRRLGELDPSVVFVPGYYTLPGLAAALWGRVHRRRTVLMSESTRMDHPRTWWTEALKKILLRLLFDYAIAGGAPHAQYLRDLGVPADRIAGCYDVVDNDFYAEAADRARNAGRPAGFSAPAEYFLYVGRLAEEKNVSCLIGAFDAYRRRGGDASLVIVGDGPLAQPLKDLAARSSCPAYIHFAGMKSAAEIAVYYAFARGLVLPSTTEPWGLVVNEAMAAGLPVIVSIRCGCVDDLVEHRVNGFVFDPFRMEDLVEALFQLEAAHQTGQAMGAHSRRIISRYSPEAWASEVARIVEG
jgi:1,2-diacylglycerol 3-alpha-glucosyltransferase